MLILLSMVEFTWLYSVCDRFLKRLTLQAAVWIFDFKGSSLYFVLISQPISVYIGGTWSLFLCNFTTSGWLKQTFHRIFLLPLLATLSKHRLMLIFERFLLRLEMSASLDVDVNVLTPNSGKRSVLVLVLAIAGSMLSLLVHTTFCSGLPMSTFYTAISETLLLAVTVWSSLAVLENNSLSIFRTIKTILLDQV